MSMAARAPDAIAFTVHGPIARDDLPGLCKRIGALLDESPQRVNEETLDYFRYDATSVEV